MKKRSDIQLIDSLILLFVNEMRVHLGCLDLLMSEKFAQYVQVDPFGQSHGCKGMPGAMKGDVLVDSSRFHPTGNMFVHGLAVGEGKDELVPGLRVLFTAFYNVQGQWMQFHAFVMTGLLLLEGNATVLDLMETDAAYIAHS